MYRAGNRQAAAAVGVVAVDQEGPRADTGYTLPHLNKTNRADNTYHRSISRLWHNSCRRKHFDHSDNSRYASWDRFGRHMLLPGRNIQSRDRKGLRLRRA